jgi:ABC-type oligopeptide transport system substrate-binding subunit
MDNDAMPGVNYVAFNTSIPPFNSPLVRQAFAYAIDRQVIAEMAQKYRAKNSKPATTLTPPETLGRELYNQVGIVFNPQKAKDLLTQAGYSNPYTFPTVTMIVNAYGDIAPGARFNMANAMVEMWQKHLGISVHIKVIKTFKDYGNRLKTNPPEIFWQGWVADFNDPDNFLRGIFQTGSQFNYGHFSNSEFDQLVDDAAIAGDPTKRQELYILAERLLCETETALIPLYHLTYP